VALLYECWKLGLFGLFLRFLQIFATNTGNLSARIIFAIDTTSVSNFTFFGLVSSDVLFEDEKQSPTRQDAQLISPATAPH